jgi:maltokinase
VSGEALGVVLANWLPAQRWFGSKGRSVTVVRPRLLGTLVDQPRALEVFLLDVEYVEGAPEVYQVPLSRASEPVGALEYCLVGSDPQTGSWYYDAPHDKEVAGAWLRTIAGRQAHGGVHGRHDEDEPDLSGELSSLVVGHEQSNTSLVFGDSYILKLFRKLSGGVNPDLEITRALRRMGSPHVLAPLGWLETPDWDDTTLGMLQPFLRSATEGWAMATTSVRDLYAEADLHADEVGGDFAAESTRLGATTASVHQALAEVLPSRLAHEEETRSTAKQLHERLDGAVTVTPQLGEYVEDIRQAYEDFASWTAPVPVQRIHGDLHLGQVLRTEAGWILFDFEGEPARPLAERRALMSPLRDVAGMLRSFDYAARHLLAEQPVGSNLEYRAIEWAQRNRDAFCDGYAKESGIDPREHGPVLRAFELDKAVYEVVYEARNRPTWLGIPLASIERLVGR